jgi:hypothetical protein
MTHIVFTYSYTLDGVTRSWCEEVVSSLPAQFLCKNFALLPNLTVCVGGEYYEATLVHSEILRDSSMVEAPMEGVNVIA